MRFFILFFILCHPLWGMQRTPKEKNSLGVRTVRYHDEKRDRPVAVEIWYPAARPGTLESVETDGIWFHPREARDAALRKIEGKCPLILMSHGHRGGRREMSWLAEIFAAQGYVIASVDHFGDMRSQFDLFSCLRFWERPRDVTFMLDRLLQEPWLKDQIDRDRIGFIGYSLGGMTGLSLAGAQAKNVREVVAGVNKKWQQFDAKMLDQVDFSEAEKPFGDSRIQAMLLLCPATYIFSSDSFSQVRIPIGLVAAMGDEVLPFQEHAFRLIQHAIPAKLKILRKEISHYAFLNRITEAGKTVLHKAFFNDHPYCSKASIHREVGAFAIAFFKDAWGSKKHKE